MTQGSSPSLYPIHQLRASTIFYQLHEMSERERERQETRDKGIEKAIHS